MGKVGQFGGGSRDGARSSPTRKPTPAFVRSRNAPKKRAHQRLDLPQQQSHLRPGPSKSDSWIEPAPGRCPSTTSHAAYGLDSVPTTDPGRQAKASGQIRSEPKIRVDHDDELFQRRCRTAREGADQHPGLRRGARPGRNCDRTQERLPQSDAGMVLLRRIFWREIEAIQTGRPTKQWKRLETRRTCRSNSRGRPPNNGRSTSHSFPNEGPHLKVADAIARVLKAEGVEYLICYPRQALIDACAAVGIRPIICRQERVGAGIADGISRSTGGGNDRRLRDAGRAGGREHLCRRGAGFRRQCSGSADPGRGRVGRNHMPPTFSAVDNFRHVTKWAAQLNLPDRVPELMRRAFNACATGGPGRHCSNCRPT